MIKHTRIFATGAALLIAVTLSGCGGGSDNDSGSGNGGGSGQTSTPGASDTFFTKVLALIGSSPDNTEPVAIDDVAATTPDNIEPAPL